MNKKVFCSECKFFNLRFYSECNAPKNIGDTCIKRSKPIDLNKNNNCKWFQVIGVDNE
jgi:hypothetical protein